MISFENGKGVIAHSILCILLQWMAAGRGIVHFEMPDGEGPNEGLQLWINLPSKHKIYANDILLPHPYILNRWG